MIHELSGTNSILNLYLAEIRNINIQQDRLRFRTNMERISQTMGYEVSKALDYSVETITTPFGESKIHLPQNQIVIASILRAGLSMHNGLLHIFDQAENAFVSAYRMKTTDHSVKVKVEYKACPDLTGKTLIIADPMLATGQSMELVHQALLQNGMPQQVHVVSAIASEDAVNHLQQVLPDDYHIWVGAIDPEINDKSYIVPGLGDAGDLAYGSKL